jgi:hypothetical protein
MNVRLPSIALASLATVGPLLAQLRWEVVPHALAPAPRHDHAMTQPALLFGGRAANQAFADTWILEMWGWRQVTTANAPAARSGHAMVSTPFFVGTVLHDDVLLFGGEDAGGALRGDSWRFVGHHTATATFPVYVGNWQPLTTAIAPAPRAQHAMAYDWQTATEVLLFGGRTTAGANDETWRFDANGWTPVPTTNRPPARYGHTLLASPDGFVLFGGTDGTSVFTDCWRFDGTTWVRVAAPPGGGQHVTADWTTRGRNLVIASSATASGIVTTVYERTASGAWLEQQQIGAVPLRTGQTTSWWVAPAMAIAFGGRDALGAASDETLQLVPVHAAGWQGLGNGCGPGAWGNNGPDLFPRTHLLGGTGSTSVYTASANTLVALGAQLGTAPAPSCSVAIAPDVVLGFVTDPLGVATWSLPVPFDPALRGVTVSVQALALEPQSPNGLALSRLAVIAVGD